MEIFKFYIFRSCIKKPIRNKFYLYSKSGKILDHVLDISNLIKTLNEYDKLKNLILTEDQVNLLNFTSKEYLCSNKPEVHGTLNFNNNTELTKEK